MWRTSVERGGWARRSHYGRTTWDLAARAAGWPRRADGRWAWTFHSLRHVFATWALAQPGLRIEDVSRLLGHSSTRVHVHTTCTSGSTRRRSEVRGEGADTEGGTCPIETCTWWATEQSQPRRRYGAVEALDYAGYLARPAVADAPRSGTHRPRRGQRHSGGLRRGWRRCLGGADRVMRYGGVNALNARSRCSSLTGTSIGPLSAIGIPTGLQERRSWPGGGREAWPPAATPRSTTKFSGAGPTATPSTHPAT